MQFFHLRREGTACSSLLRRSSPAGHFPPEKYFLCLPFPAAQHLVEVHSVSATRACRTVDMALSSYRFFIVLGPVISPQDSHSTFYSFRGAGQP